MLVVCGSCEVEGKEQLQSFLVCAFVGLENEGKGFYY